jgi:hypothetical protein
VAGGSPNYIDAVRTFGGKFGAVSVLVVEGEMGDVHIANFVTGIAAFEGARVVYFTPSSVV